MVLCVPITRFSRSLRHFSLHYNPISLFPSLTSLLRHAGNSAVSP
jgi:hypothetical protein